MMKMVDLGSQRGPLGLQIIDTATTVECGREVRFRRSFRSLVECMVPCCGLFHHPIDDATDIRDHLNHSSSFSSSSSSASSSSSSSSPTATTATSTVTGTFFGNRKGRVSFCLQDDSRSSTPLLLLEFGVPTAYLAKEMQCGSLRIALECDRRLHHKYSVETRASSSSSSFSPGSIPLYGVPVWSMYCNGRKVGFAVRRQPSPSDASLLNLMRSVSMGAGVLPPPINNDNNNAGGTSDKRGGGDINNMVMYLRARFQRVVGSPHSESFHIINPVGSSAQELSIFLLRS